MSEMHDGFSPLGPLSGGPAGAEPDVATTAAVKPPPEVIAPPEAFPATTSSSAVASSSSSSSSAGRPAAVPPAAPASVPAPAAAAAFPALALPPAVVEVQGHLRRGISSSRFAWVRSDLAHMLSWVNPLQTAAVFVGLVALFLANRALAYSLPAIVTGLVVLALVASGGLVAYSGYTGRDMPALSLSLDAAMLHVGVRSGVDALAGGVAALNRALSWRDATFSTRFLAYAWLAYSYSFFATPGWLFAAAVAAFVAVPAYLLQVAAVDGKYTSLVLPNLQRARIGVEGVVEQARVAVAANGSQMLAVVAGGIVVAAALSGYFLPLDTCATLAASALAVYDGLLAVTVAAEHRAS